MKKKAIVVALAATLGSSVAQAKTIEYQMLVPIKVENGDWLSTDPLYSQWLDDGGHYDCQAWTPDVTDVDFGQTFLQYRDCLQDQTRTVTNRQEHTATGEIKETSTYPEARTITETESQNAEGERRDWTPTSSTYTSWVDASEPHSYTAWQLPSDSQIEDYEQSRTYKVTVERYEQKREQDQVTGDIREVGGPILQTVDDPRHETRMVTVSVSNWSNVSDKFCGDWSPSPETIDFGVSFTQNRNCDQDQERVWSHVTGGVEVHSVVQGRLNAFGESRQATGERRDWQPITSTFTSWSNVGSRTNHTAWSPTIAAQETDFTQSREYDQAQQRFEQKREQDQVTGDIRDVGDPIAHDQTISGTETRTVDVTVGVWTDSGAHYACSAWSPTPDTVDFGQMYTQTRDCSQDQTRTRTYQDGSTTLDSQTDNRSITETESQQATGSYRNWEATTSTFTAWTNDGSRYGYSAWSPAASSQTTSFTQTRSYSQDQDRYEQLRERDSVTGDIRNVGEPILREQTISGSESRSVTVSWSSWVNNGADQNCGTWSPAPSTVNYGESFTQSRTCDEPEKRDRIYKVGTSTINTAQETRLNEVTRTQQATGTMRDWQPISSTYTSWTNDGGRYGHTAWSPTAGSQTANFTQTRSYSQDQDRYEQKREQDAVTGDIRNVGSPILREQTISGSESRSVTVSWSSWVNNGADQNCGTWSPAPSTVNYGESFTQSRTCDEPEKRDRIYKVGTSTINTAQETRLNEVTRTQQATGTMRDWQPISSTYTSWTNDGGRYGHTAWSPTAGSQTANFTQTRSYSQDQDRYEQKREQDAVTGDIRNVGSPILHEKTLTGSENRSVTVTWSSWANSGGTFNCGTWSPGTNTVNYGVTFTQTRNCSQNQTRSRIYKVGSTTIATKPESKTVQVTEDRQAIGTYQNWEPMTSAATNWVDSGARYGHTAWSPSASTQIEDFTQSREYSQDQTRTVQKQEYDTITGQIRDVGSPTTESRTVTQTESRLVDVSVTGYTNSGSVYGCSAWSPAVSTVTKGQTFTQTRSCSQNKVRAWNYVASGSSIHSRNETTTTTVTESQSAVGTKEATECKFLIGSPGYIFYKGSTFMPTTYRWGSEVWSTTASDFPSKSSPHVRGGYKYWPGTKTDGGTYWICRAPA